MNQLLFDRSTGSLKPNAFARLQSTHLVYDIQQALNHQFDGGENSRVDLETVFTEADVDNGHVKACAHLAGVNALVVDRFEGKL
jgi:DNA excision repair protein ERCC-8